MFIFELTLHQRKVAIGLSRNYQLINFVLEQMESILNYLELRNYITELFMLSKVINFTNVNVYFLQVTKIYTLSDLTYKTLYFFYINFMF